MYLAFRWCLNLNKKCTLMTGFVVQGNFLIIFCYIVFIFLYLVTRINSASPVRFISSIICKRNDWSGNGNTLSSGWSRHTWPLSFVNDLVSPHDTSIRGEHELLLRSHVLISTAIWVTCVQSSGDDRWPFVRSGLSAVSIMEFNDDWMISPSRVLHRPWLPAVSPL